MPKGKAHPVIKMLTAFLRGPIKSMAYGLFMVSSYEFFKHLKTSLTSLSKNFFFLQTSVPAVDSTLTQPWVIR